MITPCEKACRECPNFNRPTPKPLRDIQEHGCYADTDHIIPRFLGKLAGTSSLLKNYIRSPANKQQLCRWEHDSKTAREIASPESIIVPSQRFMIDAIIRARHGKRAA